MKKALFITSMLLMTSIIIMPSSIHTVSAKTNQNQTYLAAVTSAGIVFRTTQRLRSNDGGEIYLYASGKCELFDNDRLVATCTYTIDGSEIRLLDGNVTLYKGTFRYSPDRRNVASLSLRGITYYRK